MLDSPCRFLVELLGLHGEIMFSKSVNGKSQIIEEKQTKAPIAKRKLAITYLALWFGAGLVAALFHLLARPDYISLRTCIIGGIANLFGPWVRPLAIGWPNAGKAPHAPLGVVGLVLVGIFAVLVSVSLSSRKRWLQILCLALYVPAIIYWIRLGVLELMTCAV
jgi:hypothetical protein